MFKHITSTTSPRHAHTGIKTQLTFMYFIMYDLTFEQSVQLSALTLVALVVSRGGAPWLVKIGKGSIFWIYFVLLAIDSIVTLVFPSIYALYPSNIWVFWGIAIIIVVNFGALYSLLQQLALLLLSPEIFNDIFALIYIASGIGMFCAPIVGFNIVQSANFEEDSFDFYFYVCGGLQGVSACIALYLSIQRSRRAKGATKSRQNSSRPTETGVLPGSTARMRPVTSEV